MFSTALLGSSSSGQVPFGLFQPNTDGPSGSNKRHHTSLSTSPVVAESPGIQFNSSGDIVYKVPEVPNDAEFENRQMLSLKPKKDCFQETPV